MKVKLRRPDAWRYRDSPHYSWVYCNNYPDVPLHYEIESLFASIFVIELQKELAECRSSLIKANALIAASGLLTSETSSPMMAEAHTTET